MPKNKPDEDDLDYTPGKSRRTGYHVPGLDFRSQKKQLQQLIKGKWENGEYSKYKIHRYSVLNIFSPHR